MTTGKAQTALGLSVVAITKRLMEYFSVGHEEAYRKLVSTDFFELLNDLDTGLYLEPDEYLFEGCLLELEKGSEAMYEFIGRE